MLEESLAHLRPGLAQ